jgi:thioredoxin 1
MTFEEIINSEKPVLVDFFAVWCGPCKTMSTVLEDVKSVVKDETTILKIDVDKNTGLAQKYQVKGVPTMILFKNGKILWRQSGVIPKNELVKIIQSHSL